AATAHSTSAPGANCSLARLKPTRLGRLPPTCSDAVMLVLSSHVLTARSVARRAGGRAPERPGGGTPADPRAGGVRAARERPARRASDRVAGGHGRPAAPPILVLPTAGCYSRQSSRKSALGRWAAPIGKNCRTPRASGWALSRSRTTTGAGCWPGWLYRRRGLPLYSAGQGFPRRAHVGVDQERTIPASADTVVVGGG